MRCDLSKTKTIFAILASIASIIGVAVGIYFGVVEAKSEAEPTSLLEPVQPGFENPSSEYSTTTLQCSL